MYNAAYVWTHGVDGSMWAEAPRVDRQVGGALLDHIPDDVDLHLGKQGEKSKSVDYSRNGSGVGGCKAPAVFTQNVFLFLRECKGT